MRRRGVQKLRIIVKRIQKTTLGKAGNTEYYIAGIEKKIQLEEYT
jgi:hypothetical protein